MQNKLSNIYIIIKIIYMYFKYTLLSNTEQMLKYLFLKYQLDHNTE